nr:hypothetical protein [Pseudobacteroides cellulosolvens]
MSIIAKKVVEPAEKKLKLNLVFALIADPSRINRHIMIKRNNVCNRWRKETF